MEIQNKRIIICCDGTWNAIETPTNVVKLLRGILPVSSDGKHQVVYYDQGIGTYNFFDRFLGSVFGKGIEQNVLDAYRFLVNNYRVGDEVFCFGFSRGAYTARALGGLLDTIGLLARDELQNLSAAYRYYRTRPDKRESDLYSHNLRPKITMMGVWETVGAAGVPIPILGRLSKRMVGFFNTHLSSEIKNAYQALAIDEIRAAYKPALWTGDINADQTVQQVWFAGDHCDVGGGYQQKGLADTSLLWMLEKASSLGLEFDSNYVADASIINPNSLDVLHDSYNQVYHWLEKVSREDGIRKLQGDVDNPPINVAVHDSVINRINALDDYDPVNFSQDLPVSRTDERRQFARINTSQLLASVQADEKISNAKILDFSPMGGVKIECEEDLELADTIIISSSKFAKTIATCAWKKGNTYGLQFAA